MKTLDLGKAFCWVGHDTKRKCFENVLGRLSRASLDGLFDQVFYEMKVNFFVRYIGTALVTRQTVELNNLIELFQNAALNALIAVMS